MKARGHVVLRGADGAVATYAGELVLADGGIWLRRDRGTWEGAPLAAILGAEAGAGAWLFLPLHMVAGVSTDDDPAE